MQDLNPDRASPLLAFAEADPEGRSAPPFFGSYLHFALKGPGMNHAAHPMFSTLVLLLFLLAWLLVMGYILPKLGIPT